MLVGFVHWWPAPVSVGGLLVAAYATFQRLGMLLSLTVDLLNPMVVGLAADGCEKKMVELSGS